MNLPRKLGLNGEPASGEAPSTVLLTPELEALRREIAADYENRPEGWMARLPRWPAASTVSLRRLVRLFEQHRDAEAINEMQRFVRLSRFERGETVIPFPSRPRRPIPPPADFPPAAA